MRNVMLDGALCAGRAAASGRRTRSRAAGRLGRIAKSYILP